MLQPRFTALITFSLAAVFAFSAQDGRSADGSGQASSPIFDTTLRFFPQVATTSGHPANLPRMSSGVESLLTPQDGIDGSFPGMGYTFLDPPCPNIAVSATHVLQVVNSDIAFFTKAGVKQFQQSLDGAGFFQGVSQTDSVFDPKCVYDQGAKRFIVMALEFRESPANSGILFAISDDANPNGSWTKYRIETKTQFSGENAWLDYPGFGYNKDGLVITGNYFTFGNNIPKGARSYAIQKAGLLSNGVVHYSWFNHPTAFTIMPTRIFESVSARVFGVSTKNPTTLTLYAWSSLGGTASIATKDVTVPTYNYFAGKAASTGGKTLEPIGDRMMDAAYRSGYLVCAHTIKVSATDNRAMVRWYEFAMGNWPSSGAPTRRQSGNITLAAPNHLFMPAIARNGNGAISMVLTRSSTTRTADLYALSHKSTDALGKFGPLNLVKASSHNALSVNTRWGEYFSLTNDPSSATRFWGCGEVLGNDGQWVTQIAHWTVP